ncbi:o-spanin [Xylella phage Salvo]|uniref:O-spanin n=1 Tax=Xylella phage Salvo TaxID=1415147 RepID=V5Q7X3_9CAUD|nr:o-spanin [Xylella phage Salvo]AHB12234.1 o-spanin [Xylella phage Salvo]
MMCTKSRPSLRLLLLVLVFTLSTSGCKTGSAKRELPQLKQEAPLVNCKQPASPAVPREPKADEWIEWNPPRPGKTEGEARLSERAVNWIIDVLGVVRVSEGYRRVEHGCLDDLEAKGLIRQ